MTVTVAEAATVALQLLEVEIALDRAREHLCKYTAEMTRAQHDHFWARFAVYVNLEAMNL